MNELVSQRDAALFMKQQNEQRELEQREVRFRVVEEFLNLRGLNVSEVGRWSAILLDEFTLRLPNSRPLLLLSSSGTGDDHDNHNSVYRPDQVLVGVTEVMRESQSFASILQTMAPPPAQEGTPPIFLQYHCDRKNFLMDGCNAVLDWTAVSVGSVQRVRLFCRHMCMKLCHENQ